MHVYMVYMHILFVHSASDGHRARALKENSSDQAEASWRWREQGKASRKHNMKLYVRMHC